MTDAQWLGWCFRLPRWTVKLTVWMFMSLTVLKAFAPAPEATPPPSRYAHRHELAVLAGVLEAYRASPGH